MRSDSSPAGAPRDGQVEDPAVLQASVENAKRVVGGGRNSTLTRRWPDLLAGVAAVILLPRLVYVLWTAPYAEKPEPTASRGLPAFTVLQLDHMARMDGQADTLRERLVGRYLVRPVRAQSPITPSSLGPASLSAALLEGRHVLPLQLAAGAAPDSLRAGEIADLLLSPSAPAQGGTPAFVQRVPVLAVSATAEGMRVVVAVDRAQLDALAPRIGTSRVFVLTGGGPAPAVPTVARDPAPAPPDSATGGGG